MTNENSLTQIVHYQVLHFIQFSHLWENQVGKLLVITYCTSLKASPVNFIYKWKILEYKTKVNQIVIDNYCYLNFTSTEKILFEENIQWRKYIKYIILLKFCYFHNKQKEFLNELNSLVAIYFIISLRYKNKWTSKIFV